jgi:hypothetical protein
VWVQAGRETLVEVPQPWTDFIQVSTRVIAAEGLKRVQLDLRYDDGTFQSDSMVSLDKDSADESGVAWAGKTTLPQVDKSKQRFRYRYSVEGAGQLGVGPWVETEGDQEIVLPVLAVKLRTERLKLGTDFSEALLQMRYIDASRHFEYRHEFFLNKDKPTDAWLVPRVDPNLDAYKYRITLFKPSGETIEMEEKDGQGENLILVPPGPSP